MADSCQRCASCGASLKASVRFCEACGKPVSAGGPGPRFCGQCGGPLEEGARFCVACGAPAAGLQPQPAPAAPAPASAPAYGPPPPPQVASASPPSAPAYGPPPPQPAYGPPSPARAAVHGPPAPAYRPMARKGGGNVLGKLIVVLVGLLLISFGLQGPLLGAFGATTTAVVTDVSPGEETAEYTIEYRFSVGGREFRGSVERQAYNVATLPGEGSTMRVRYLRAMPTINSPVSGGPSPAATLGAIVLGIVVVILGLKLSWRISSGGGD